MPIFQRTTELPFAAPTVFAWHERPGALERLTPPWQAVRVLERHGTIHDGDRVVLELSVGPFKHHWVAVHRDLEPGRQFRDVQVRGPFARWIHTHRFVPLDAARSRLEDHIDYGLPLGLLGELAAGHEIERMLDRLFRFRHLRTEHDLMRHEPYAHHPRLRIALTGASGLIGRQLSAFLTTGGHEVLPLVRRPPGEHEIFWDPDRQEIELSRLEGLDAVIHLAGENIGAGRWSPERKAAVLESRRRGTLLLSEALAKLQQPPRVLLSASAIGYYGSRGDEALTEDSPAGEGFLTEVCEAWEAGTAPARAAGIRVAHMRFGVVLTSGGGALAQMLPPFKAGVGGIIGSGRQVMSWVALDDVIGALYHALFTESLEGPVNVTSPDPVTNAEFTRVLGKVLRRPTLFPLPAPAIRLLFGEMGQALLLEGARVLPTKLEASGFRFQHPRLEDALRLELGHLEALHA